MALSDLVPAKDTVITHGGSFDIHPLTVHDLGVLVTENREALESLFQGELDLMSLVADAPDFAALIIALSAKEPDMVSVALNLPVSTQVEALDKVWGLTVYDPKLFMATVQKLLSSMGVEKDLSELKQTKPKRAAVRKAGNPS